MMNLEVRWLNALDEIVSRYLGFSARWQQSLPNACFPIRPRAVWLSTSILGLEATTPYPMGQQHPGRRRTWLSEVQLAR